MIVKKPMLVLFEVEYDDEKCDMKEAPPGKMGDLDAVATYFAIALNQNQEDSSAESFRYNVLNPEVFPPEAATPEIIHQLRYGHEKEKVVGQESG